jgi:hypothetical protein
MRGLKILPWEIVVVVPMLYHLDFIPDHYVYDFWRTRRLEWSSWEVHTSLFHIWKVYRLKAKKQDTTISFSGTLFMNMLKFAGLLYRDHR